MDEENIDCWDEIIFNDGDDGDHLNSLIEEENAREQISMMNYYYETLYDKNNIHIGFSAHKGYIDIKTNKYYILSGRGLEIFSVEQNKITNKLLLKSSSIQIKLSDLNIIYDSDKNIDFVSANIVNSKVEQLLNMKCFI